MVTVLQLRIQNKDLLMQTQNSHAQDNATRTWHRLQSKYRKNCWNLYIYCKLWTNCGLWTCKLDRKTMDAKVKLQTHAACSVQHAHDVWSKVPERKKTLDLGFCLFRENPSWRIIFIIWVFDYGKMDAKQCIMGDASSVCVCVSLSHLRRRRTLP